MWVRVALSVLSTAEMRWLYVSTSVASSRMGDHSWFLATNTCHTYKRVSTNLSSPYKQPTIKKI